MTHAIDVAGPYFEDLEHGSAFVGPAVTLTDGYASTYQATFGDRMLLPLDHPSCAAVTGSRVPLAHPLLVTNVAIGQSTWASQRVKANLFYRGLSLLRPVFIGDTLYTHTRVVALRRNRRQAGRPDTGIVGLEVVTQNQNREVVLHFWRCPMIPCREETSASDAADELDSLGRSVAAPIIPPWGFQHMPAAHPADPAKIGPGAVLRIEARDTVTAAPQFVRLTLNMAMGHTDAQFSQLGERLVYGGHTISMCFAQLTRALPRLAWLLSWEHCDHLAPVFENDRLRSEFMILDSVAQRDIQILTINARCFAARGTPETETQVLDWEFKVLNVPVT